MLPRLLLAVAAAALLIAAPARAESLLGSWDDLRDLARVDRPAALAPGPDGSVWYTAPGTDHVGAIGGDGRTSAFAPAEPDGGPDGYGLGAAAVLPNADGTAWVLDARARLGLWRLEDAQLLRRVKMLPGASDGALPAWRTPGGSIFVADDDVLAQLRPDGTLVRLRPFGRGGDVDVAAVGPDGRLWLYGSRPALKRRLVKVDDAGRVESAATGEDGFEGATLTWGGGGVVAGDTLWQPAVRTIGGRDEAVLLGAAAGRPLQQVRLGLKPGGSGWHGGFSIGAGAAGTILVAERRDSTVSVLEGGKLRRLATLARGDDPEEPMLDAAGRIWLSLSRGRLATVDPGGAVVEHADGIPRDPAPPALTVRLPSRDIGRLASGALRVRVGCDVACGAEVHLAIPRASARRLGLRGSGLQLVPLPRGWVPLATAAPTRPVSGSRVVRFRLARGARRGLAGMRTLRVRLIASAFDQGLDLTRTTRTLTLR